LPPCSQPPGCASSAPPGPCGGVGSVSRHAGPRSPTLLLLLPLGGRVNQDRVPVEQAAWGPGGPGQVRQSLGGCNQRLSGAIITRTLHPAHSARLAPDPPRWPSSRATCRWAMPP
jgi:hypothetical protein